MSSYCFPNKDSSLSCTSFGVLSPSRWKRNSLEMWMHMKPNASSNLFICLDFSRGCWVLTFFPWWPCTYPFSQYYLHVIPPIKIVEWFEDSGCQSYWILHLIASRTTNSLKYLWMYLQKHCKTLQFAIKPSQTLSTSTVHFLWVHHTWLDFSGHNPEGSRQE